MRSTIAAAMLVLTMALCHEPEQPPPAPPPTPTNPTIKPSSAHTVAWEKTETIDASIVSDGSPGPDAGVELDTGVSTRATR
jgi:hypothetical protein